MAVEALLPSLVTVIVTAAIDSINPCAIGVLILLVSSMVVSRKKEEMLRLGLIYVAAVYVTYFLAGLGLAFFFAQIPLVFAQYISLFVALLVVLAGLIEIKDYFWYGKGISLQIPADKARKIHDMANNLSMPGLVALGIFVAGVELPCTGGPYLAIIMVLSQNFDFTALLLLLLYNFIFVLPLIAILLLVYFGSAKIQDVKQWKQSNRGYMRLLIGLLLVVLGWVLILIANGTINLG